MDKIRGFSDDELLVKILSYLPTKVAVSTSILSKHWKFLWMRTTKLEFDESTHHRIHHESYRSKSKRLHRFIAMNLPLHPVKESLSLKILSTFSQPEDIKRWVEIAVSRCVPELSITCHNTLLLSNLYTCKTLVTLKLTCTITVDVPSVVTLPSLKILHLLRVRYANEESLQRLLSNCYVLEDLILELCVNLRNIVVIILSLLSSSITIYGTCTYVGCVIDTPSLKYFKATDYSQTSSVLIVNMPKLGKADFALPGFCDYVRKLLNPVTFIKCLSISAIHDIDEDVYGDDIVFHELKHLEFQKSNTYWCKLLLWLLKSSPKLRHFEFEGNVSQYGMKYMDTSVCWKQLVYVPQCLLSSLQTFKWTCNNPMTAERGLVTYILKYSCRLKTATFLIESSPYWGFSSPCLTLPISMILSVLGSDA